MQANSNISNKRSANIQKKTHKPVFHVIPLGGMEEIGKNCTVIECGDDMILIDCGLKFPDSEQYGIDLVIPDFTYLEENEQMLRGLFLTHGHEDHIGSIPYLLRKFPELPIYGTKLTIGLLQNKLVEHGLDKTAKLNIVSYHETVEVSGFSVEFVVTNHSIADSAALYVKCPGGSVFHTGDFKIDLTPVDNQRIDLARFAEIGSEGVDVLIADSTNAGKKGYTPSERTVGESFHTLFAGVKKRIVIASFATNIHRIQQIFDAARFFGRKVTVSGRSMINVVGVAKNLGYLRFDDDDLIDIKDVGKFPDEEIVVLTTGSQGEPLSALSRMASGEHRQVKIDENDLVIISATPIPGNEKSVASIISELMKLGAQVVYQGAKDVHVSGHASAGDLSLIQALVRPKYFVPCHGEYQMLISHALIAQKAGLSSDNTFVMQNGDVLTVDENEAYISGSVTSGAILIDGLGVGDVGNIVLKDRKRLSEDGLFIIVAAVGDNGIMSGPDIVSRGFVYMRESEDLLAEAKEHCVEVILRHGDNFYDYNSIKADLKGELEKFLYEKTKRRPMILPILMYVKE